MGETARQLTPHELLLGQVRQVRKRARLDPVWFAKTWLRLKLDPWQEELLEAAADVVRKTNRKKTKVNHKGLHKITVRSPHGPGKTFGAALLLHWFGFCFRGLSPATAPKLAQLKTRLLREFRKIRAGAVPGYDELVEVRSDKIEWVGDPDWGVQAETGKEPENLQGYHDNFMLIVVDEASGVREEMFPAIEAALSTGVIVILVLISNPTKNRGSFYDSHKKRGVRESYYQLHVTPENSSRISRKWIQEMEAKYGATSPVVLVRCYGEFADSDENQLVPLDYVTEAFDREPLDDGSLPRLRVTCDVADGGEDETVIQVGKRYDTWTHFLRQETFSFPKKLSPILAAEAVERIFHAWGGNPANGDDMVIDAIGVGAGTAGYLMKATHPETGAPRDYNVIPFVGGAASDNPKKWRNKRTQGYLVFRDELRDGCVVFDEAFTDRRDDYEAQLCSVHTKPGQERVEDLETKQEMKARGIKSPDMSDGSMMMYATDEPVLAQERHREVNTEVLQQTTMRSEVADSDAYLT